MKVYSVMNSDNDHVIAVFSTEEKAVELVEYITGLTEEHSCEVGVYEVQDEISDGFKRAIKNWIDEG